MDYRSPAKHRLFLSPSFPPATRILLRYGLLPVGALLMASLFAHLLHAQSPPIRWGDVPEEHLAMTEYEPDPDAEAIVLADYGNVSFRSNGRLVLERHTRVKLLSRSGFEHATVDVPYVSEDRLQRVQRVRGRTYVLAENGEVEEIDMEQDAVFDEDVDGRRSRVRFTLPALQEGAVIEYRYRIESRNFTFLPDWRFQRSIPTLHSEYRALIPAALHYTKWSTGMQEFDVQESNQRHTALGSAMNHRWVMKDIPALREEPYMTTPRNYQASIRFQLRGFEDARGAYTSIRSSWDELASELMRHRNFGRYLSPSRAVRRHVDELLEGVEAPGERLEVLYDYASAGLEWDGQRSMFADERPRDVLERRTGNSADITLTFVAMLQAAGFVAHPVLISTRSHGATLPMYPMVTQFNDVLVAVELNEGWMLLSPVSDLLPMGLLPPAALNQQGWLVRENEPEWIPIEPPGQSRVVSVSMLSIDENGRLSGRVDQHDYEYAALTLRVARRSMDDDENFVREAVLSSLDGVTLADWEIEENDEDMGAIAATATIEWDHYAQTAGDFIYLNPHVLGRFESNPFTREERTFPVDYTFPRSNSHTIQIQIPEGYEFYEVPDNTRIVGADDSMLYQRLLDTRGNILQMRLQFVRNETRFDALAYDAIRQFYDEVVAAGAEQIVLRRIEEPRADDDEDENSEGGR